MSDQKQRTPEEEKVYQQGRADAFAEAAKKNAKAVEDETPAHLRDNYSGPISGEQALQINARRAEKAAKAAPAVETKPASTQATK